jgi:hypothetical protein
MLASLLWTVDCFIGAMLDCLNMMEAAKWSMC